MLWWYSEHISTKDISIVDNFIRVFREKMKTNEYKPEDFEEKFKKYKPDK